MTLILPSDLKYRSWRSLCKRPVLLSTKLHTQKDTWCPDYPQTNTQCLIGTNKFFTFTAFNHFCALSFLFFLPDHVYLPGCEVKACLVLTVLLCFLHFTGESLSWCPLRHVAYYCSSGKKFTDFIIYRNHPLWKWLHENRLLFWCSQFTVWRYLLGKCFLWPSYETC